MITIRYFEKCLIIIVIFVGLISCNDIVEVGAPMSRNPELKVEYNDYYAQIDINNIDETAFIYRWLNISDGIEWLISVSNDGDNYIEIKNRSILTYNGVREQAFTNNQLLEIIDELAVERKGEVILYITLQGKDANGIYVTAQNGDSEIISRVHIFMSNEIINIKK